MAPLLPFRRAALGLFAALALSFVACNQGSAPPLARLTDARKLAADLRVEFNQAADASNRAVMADTDEASVRYAAEAEQAKRYVRRDADALAPLLKGLDYPDEARALAEFDQRFATYAALDHTVLVLAVENTNLKAQQISFGPAREAADAFRAALESVSKAAAAKSACKVAPLVAAAVIAVREIQVLQAPHIAESDDAAMTRMEKQMTELEATARASLVALAPLVDPAAQPQLAAATASLDTFDKLHAELLVLSRRNSNVRSLMLSLGEKRTLTSACEASLTTLADGLAKKGFTATR